MSVIDPKTTKQQDDVNENQSNPQLATGSGALTSGRSATFSSGAPQKQGSGRFTNLQKYISANQGAGENIANRMSNVVENSYGDFSKDFQSKIGDINTGVQQGNQLFDTQGNQFKDTLSNLSNELGTFNSMVDRDRFNTASQGLIDFNRNQGVDFNKLRTGAGFDEAALQGYATQASGLADQTIQNIQDQQRGIQTEAGRYNLLKQARPKLQDYTSGQGRLDQLFFQATPSAVNNLQNTYGQQIADARSKQANEIAQANASINSVLNRENQYKTDLQNIANQAQSTFYNKLNQQTNFDQVNDARTALYNDYVNQLQTGKVSQDLANLLGISGQDMRGFGYGTSYSPSGSIGDNKMSPTYYFGPNENQFTQYNTGRPISEYLVQNTTPARQFQDILTADDYAAYQALQGLSGVDTGKAYGSSNLGAAVGLGANNYRADLIGADEAFRNKFVNPETGRGNSFNVYSTGIASSTPSSWQVFQEMNPNLDINPTTFRYNQISDIIKENVGDSGSFEEYKDRARSKYSPSVFELATAQAGVDVDKYLTNNGVQSAIGDLLASGGSGMFDQYAVDTANLLANERVKGITNEIDDSGVKNIADFTDQDTKELEQYRRFKGLL